jgi:predicted MPP superfamily phosphohydrolase
MDADTEKLKVYTPKKLKSGNVGWIYQKIIEGVEKFGTKFIFIDHLDFLTPQRQTDEQRRIVISDICIELKNLAKELGVVVFLLAHVRKVQFSRAVELQDLSESGATYKLADFVFTIEREASIENISGKKAEVYRTNNGTVRMLKNRLTGVQPIMNFQMCSDIIVPIEYADEKKESGELNIEVVDEEDKKISLFGGTND